MNELKLIIKYLPVIYVAAMTLIAFLVMGWDKLCAKREARRVPEKTLFLLAIIGGSIGSIAGMYAFRHKTQHWYFKIGFPLILILQIAAIIAVKYWLAQ